MMKRLRIALLSLAATILLLFASSALAEYKMPYSIVVDLGQQMVVVYNTKTSLPERYMICSSGKASTPTIRGTFTLPGYPSYSWCAFPGCYVRYPTRIKGGYYFHSILYSSRKASSLNQDSWKALGSRASHGCVRLAPIDAQWISYHCKKGTRVRIVNNSGIPGLRNKHQELVKLYKNVLGHEGVQPTLSPTPTPTPPTLRLGDVNSRVKTLKAQLKKHGYYNGSTAGATFDANAVAAWKQFEKDAGLTADGVATPQEQAALSSDTQHIGYAVTLKKGSVGLVVTKAEERLKALGFFSGAPNTTYDAATAKAVKRFQTAGGMAATGKLTGEQQKLLHAAAAPTPTPTPPLSLGSSGATVKALQKRLLSLGFYAGATNGRYTQATADAVSAFQKAAGLAQTGAADSALQARISTDDTLTGTARVLRSGSRGVVVRRFKERLSKLGYLGASAVNETYNASTARVVKTFQKTAGLPVTGRADPATQEKAIELAGK